MQIRPLRRCARRCRRWRSDRVSHEHHDATDVGFVAGVDGALGAALVERAQDPAPIAHDEGLAAEYRLPGSAPRRRGGARGSRTGVWGGRHTSSRVLPAHPGAQLDAGLVPVPLLRPFPASHLGTGPRTRPDSVRGRRVTSRLTSNPESPRAAGVTGGIRADDTHVAPVGTALAQSRTAVQQAAVSVERCSASAVPSRLYMQYCRRSVVMIPRWMRESFFALPGGSGATGYRGREHGVFGDCLAGASPRRGPVCEPTRRVGAMKRSTPVRRARLPANPNTEQRLSLRQ